MKTQTYAGIGSRNTPADVCSFMTEIASHLETKSFILRSGGAKGADTAFANGVKSPDMKQIFYSADGKHIGAQIIAAYFHPNWKACSQYARELHARNGFQILGPNLNSPVDFVICWTEDGAMKGGTSQALRIANALGIPVFNLGLSDTPKYLESFLESEGLL